ncbi:flagellin [Methanoculleus sp. FWC-SCC1]|uniref:Flagellin n=1 Tax=Methanoculleus frigidifontis TaxID=2584085 RepID=A0ABT8M8N2_9EURY|nr:archaellin/type IV pilin N-terminal domain-containing protein [Methanoculleus sp. FWC-SCC1]MDN7024300.1 flagellin [Methanoculleus sp. FWC-SCC1]
MAPKKSNEIAAVRHPACDDGFTGLEAAIILIAFIVVASVFAFAVLGSGFFATQKSQEVIHAGIDQSANALVLGGTVACQANNLGTELKLVRIYLQTAGAGTGTDMTRINCRIALADTLLSIPPGDPRIAVTWRYRADSDDILEENELACITIDVRDADISAGDTFTIELTADTGSALALTRTAPPEITASDYYELM